MASLPLGSLTKTHFRLAEFGFLGFLMTGLGSIYETVYGRKLRMKL
jgi:hypothetical protein